MKTKFKTLIGIITVLITGLALWAINDNPLDKEVEMKTLKKEFLSALYAEKPNPELGNKLNLFGQFVGEWEFDWYGYEPNKEKEHERGEWIFSWTLDGRAIQDLWIIPGRERRKQAGLPKGEYGTGIRFYNVTKNVWNMVWVGPIKGRFNTFEAKQHGDEIIMEEMNSEEGRMRWIFSNIQKDSFHWRAVLSSDNGQSWILVQEMFVKRKK